MMIPEAPLFNDPIYNGAADPVIFWNHSEKLWWMVVDYWRGQGVYRSVDCLSWEYAGMILDKPGNRTDDNNIGNHADVLVIGEEAYIFYFTHPPRPEGWLPETPLPIEYKRTSIQVARLHRQGDTLICDRDEEFNFVLPDMSDKLDI